MDKIYIEPREDGEWAVRDSDSDRARKVFKTQSRALVFARKTYPRPVALVVMAADGETIAYVDRGRGRESGSALEEIESEESSEE